MDTPMIYELVLSCGGKLEVIDACESMREAEELAKSYREHKYCTNGTIFIR